MRCGGGASLAAVVRRATEAALAGIEFGCAIPGTVGGAVRMNAGAYGSEIRGRAALGRRRLGDGDAERRPGRARAELPALERARRARSSPRPCCGSSAATATRCARGCASMQRRRSESQPRKARTFGSVFKNPDEGPGAGALIEACGLKGHVIGGARHLDRPRELHRERRRRALGRRRGAGLARPALRARAFRGRSRARGGAARARQPGAEPTHRVAGGATDAPKRGACSSPQPCSCAAVPPPWSRPPRACALVAGAVELGYLWLKGSSVFVLRSVAVRGGTESDRVAARDAVARAAAGRSLLALSASHVAGAIEAVPTIRIASVDRDFPHTLRIRIVPERPVALAGRARATTAASSPRAAACCASSSRGRRPRRCRASGPHERPVPGGTFHAAPNAGHARCARDATARLPRQVANVQLRPGPRHRHAAERRARDHPRPAARAPEQAARGRLGAASLPHEGGPLVPWSTPMCRRPTGPRSCRVAATRRPRASGTAEEDARQGFQKRSEWRMMQATMVRMRRSCIVRFEPVRSCGAAVSSVSERG